MSDIPGMAEAVYAIVCVGRLAWHYLCNVRKEGTHLLPVLQVCSKAVVAEGGMALSSQEFRNVAASASAGSAKRKKQERLQQQSASAEGSSTGQRQEDATQVSDGVKMLHIMFFFCYICFRLILYMCLGIRTL